MMSHNDLAEIRNTIAVYVVAFFWCTNEKYSFRMIERIEDTRVQKNPLVILNLKVLCYKMIAVQTISNLLHDVAVFLDGTILFLQLIWFDLVMNHD